MLVAMAALAPSESAMPVTQKLQEFGEPMVTGPQYGSVQGQVQQVYVITPATLPPTFAPTSAPTFAPTSAPTFSTPHPTDAPTFAPTSRPTNRPTSAPTIKPTSKPTRQPSTAPTRLPSSAPTHAPTAKRTRSPTAPPAIVTFRYGGYNMKRIRVQGQMNAHNIMNACLNVGLIPLCDHVAYYDGNCRVPRGGGHWHFSYRGHGNARGIPWRKTNGAYFYTGRHGSGSLQNIRGSHRWSNGHDRNGFTYCTN